MNFCKAILASLFMLLSLSSLAIQIDLESGNTPPNQLRIKITQAQFAKYFSETSSEKVEFEKAQVRTQAGVWSNATVKIRGKSCRFARRKCLGVKSKKPLAIYDPDNGQTTMLKKFNLVSMWQEKGYVSSKLGYHFFQKVGLYDEKTYYIEVVINDESQGLYLLVQRPVDLAKKKFKSPMALRSRLGSGYEFKYHKKKLTSHPVSDYINAYQQLTAKAQELSGEDYYDFLAERMNIDKYLLFLATNTFLQNGDYTDEIYFYALPQSLENNGAIYFDFIPWDLDDLFKIPHLSFQNWMIYLPNRITSLIYSLELNLDRNIAADDFLYKKYKEIFKQLLTTKLTEDSISKIVQKVKNEITPYSEIERILSVSAWDKPNNEYNMFTAYTQSSIEYVLKSRESKLKKRRKKLLRKLR